MSHEKCHTPRLTESVSTQLLSKAILSLLERVRLTIATLLVFSPFATATLPPGKNFNNGVASSSSAGVPAHSFENLTPWGAPKDYSTTVFSNPDRTGIDTHFAIYGKNLWVLDPDDRKLVVYGDNGEFKKAIQIPKGEGPQEVPNGYNLRDIFVHEGEIVIRASNSGGAKFLTFDETTNSWREYAGHSPSPKTENIITAHGLLTVDYLFTTENGKSFGNIALIPGVKETSVKETKVLKFSVGEKYAADPYSEEKGGVLKVRFLGILNSDEPRVFLHPDGASFSFIAPGENTLQIISLPELKVTKEIRLPIVPIEQDQATKFLQEELESMKAKVEKRRGPGKCKFDIDVNSYPSVYRAVYIAYPGGNNILHVLTTVKKGEVVSTEVMAFDPDQDYKNVSPIGLTSKQILEYIGQTENGTLLFAKYHEEGQSYYQIPFSQKK